MTEETNFERPFDILQDMEGEGVTITLKDGSKVIGDLHAFDKHINMALKNAEIHPSDKNGYYEAGQYFQRGDSVKSVEPEGEDPEIGGN